MNQGKRRKASVFVPEVVTKSLAEGTLLKPPGRQAEKHCKNKWNRVSETTVLLKGGITYMQEKNPIQVSERIFQVIEYLARSGPSGLLEISSALNLNKTTVHRILNSLICMDYVRQNFETSKYFLGFKLCHISNQILAQSNIIDIVRPCIRKLAKDTGETVHLVQIEGTQAVYLDKIDTDSHSVRLASMIGKTVPLYCSGVGKALLADRSDEVIKEIWNQSEITKRTEYTITDFSELMREISQIRKDGCSFDREENELGISCIAVSLKDFRGKSSHAVSITAPTCYMNASRLETFRELILDARAQICKTMGNL